MKRASLKHTAVPKQDNNEEVWNMNGSLENGTNDNERSNNRQLRHGLGDTSMTNNTGRSRDPKSPEKLELPRKKSSHSLFGTLRKRISTSFHKKRNSTHDDHVTRTPSHVSDLVDNIDNSERSSDERHEHHLKKASDNSSYQQCQHSDSVQQNGMSHHTSATTDNKIIDNGITDEITGASAPRNEVTVTNHTPITSVRNTNDISLRFPMNTLPLYDQVRNSLEESWCLTKELLKLSKHGWYWGPISRNEAEEKLLEHDDGCFLVRDSSDERYLLSLSFRSSGKTLHTRIEHCNGVFSFYAQPESEGYPSIVDLIENSMSDSEQGIFCYSQSRQPGAPTFAVRLTKPISRFSQVRTLQYLCRFTIRQYTRVDNIQRLPLPRSIKGWIAENQY